MLDLDKDIKAGLDFLSGNRWKHYNASYGSSFMTTNEYLELYFPKFSIDNGKVLTVASSGDHVLQSIKEGAKDIHAFDYNPFQLYVTKLKVASCLALDCKQFRNYYYNDDRRGYFRLDYYRIVRDYLDEYSRKFWDTMYLIGDFEKNFESFIILGNSWHSIVDPKGFYMNSDNYYITKNNIDKVNFCYYNSDLFDILKFIPKDIKFDGVLFSNIYDWLGYDDKNKYIDFVRNKLVNYLSDKGMIAVYSPVGGCNDIYLENIFSDYIDMGSRGKTITYKKLKK